MSLKTSRAASDPGKRSREKKTRATDQASIDLAPGYLTAREAQTAFEQHAGRDRRGLMLVGAGRSVIAINESARALVDYRGELPALLSEVVRDVNLGFAVGDAIHDRQEVWHEAYAPDPDRLLVFHIVPVLKSTGEPFVATISIQDVTRLRHLETVRRDFVANVSHELRTPIASINLMVETLQKNGTDDPEAAAHFLERIEVETRSMARLVEELLELSKLESGALSLDLEASSIRELVSEVVKRLGPAAQEKQISVEIEMPDTMPSVLVDTARIEQVLMNLVHNAIKFTPDSGSVTVRAMRQGPGVQVEVADTGVGMDPEEAGRIFERFYKVDRGRNREEGSGLGLAIARHLLELHGSHLQIVSEVGRGSRFSFSLPNAP